MTFPVALLDPQTAYSSSEAPRRIRASTIAVNSIAPSLAISGRLSDPLIRINSPWFANAMTLAVPVREVPLTVVRKIYSNRQLVVAQPSPWSALRRKLEEMQHLEDGWDSYQAPAPGPLAIAAAEQVLDGAFEVGVVPAAISPSAEGGVFIAFDGSAGRANIECFNDGTAYGATVADSVAVWHIANLDTGEISAALERIAEHTTRSR